MHRALSRVLTALLVVPLVAALPSPHTTSGAATAATPTATTSTAARVGTHATGGHRVAERRAVFEVTNDSSSDPLCSADGEDHRLRGTLVGPSGAVQGREPVLRVNVLLHDAGTGGWFWHLRHHPAYDYATKLAQAGETSLVLDRLGYGRSPLADGTRTCLAAQAAMVHQVVQSLYSGTFHFRDGRPSLQASHVVLHGHGTGATVAQLESAEFYDVQGVVLMSPPTTSPSALALETLGRQSQTCAGGATYAAFGDTARRYRELLFASAPAGIRRAATTRREATPCGDVASVPRAVVAADSADLEGPVLRLFGSKDARRSGNEESGKDGVTTTRTLQGAGNALPLERQAGDVRRIVLRWLGGLTGF